MNGRAVILMGHGSRAQDAAEAMERIAARLGERHGHSIVEVCYMSMRGPTFAEAFARCAQQGASEVVVIPYFLHRGMHIRVDIPRMMQAEAAAHPEVRVVLGPHLGFDECLVDLVHRRVEESAAVDDVRTLPIATEEDVLAEGTGRQHATA